jgi:hypothetical protein
MSKVYLPVLYIKLNLIKILVKAVGKESKGFVYLRQKFPRLSEAKIKEVIFVSLQINQLFKDQFFSTKLSSTKRRAWKAFENVYRNFLVSEMAHN